MTILTILYVIIAVVVMFGAAIFLHEFGHYWVALKLGMKVEEFAIGMGPKMFSFTRNGIVYSIRWIPAGGFVKLPQMITSEALEGHADATVPPATPTQKILVAFAGPFMNVVFAFAIATFIYFVGLPIEVNPAIIGYIEPGSEEAQLGILEGDRIVSVNGDRVKSWQDVALFTIVARTNVLPVVIEHAGKEQTFQLKATVNEAVGLKLLNLDPRDHPQVMEVIPGGAAEKAGVKEGDIILSFADVPIASRDQFIEMIHKRGEQPTVMRIERGREKLAINITPAVDPTTKSGRIGAALGSSSKSTYIVMKPGPTPWDQVTDVVDKTVKTISALVHSKQTGVGLKDLSGPPGIFAMLADRVIRDYRLALSFLVLLNINLAVLNMLPIPVLDGGHIMLALIEKIRRRPLSMRIQEYTTTAFAVLLISLMIYVSYNDAKRWRLFRAMFKAETQIEQVQGGNQPAAPTTAK